MSRLAKYSPWFAASFGLGITLWLFYPGFMSWDSAYQWWQARHANYDAVQPPLMAMIWHLCNDLWPGPGGMFVLQNVLIWSALAAFTTSLDRPLWQKSLLVLLIGFWPPLFGLSLHLWKDLWTMQAFAWSVVFLLADLRNPSRVNRLLAIIAIIFACTFRHNALLGAVPLLFWLVHRDFLDSHKNASSSLKIAVTLLLTITVLLVSKLPNVDSRVKHTESVWSVVTLWDASAVSLAEGRLIIPDILKEDSLSLQDIKHDFKDYSNTSIYESGKIKNSFIGPYSPEQQKALLGLMWSLPIEHTRPYLQHRARLAALLYGLDQNGLPDDQVLMPLMVQYRDNPAVEVMPAKYSQKILRLLQSLVDTPFFAGWIYLGLALLLGLMLFAPRRSATTALSITIAASSLAYALPLSLVSGSAEFRYLAWPILASLMSWVLLMSPMRQRKFGGLASGRKPLLFI